MTTVGALLCQACGELLTDPDSDGLRAAQDHWLDWHYGDTLATAMFTSLDRTVVELEQMYAVKAYRAR